MILNVSWSLHNVIAWMKAKSLLPRRASQVFICTIILVQVYWIVEIYANFAFFHGRNDVFLKTRPWEAICRDPWWIFANSVLFWNIKARYHMTLKEVIGISPRFGVMLFAASLAMIFFVLDICSVTNTLVLNLPNGINPFWKISSVFKCLMDCMILDDFKTALERLRAYKTSRMGSFSQDTSDVRAQDGGALVQTWEELEAGAHRREEAFRVVDHLQST